MDEIGLAEASLVAFVVKIFFNLADLDSRDSVTLGGLFWSLLRVEVDLNEGIVVVVDVGRYMLRKMLGIGEVVWKRIPSAKLMRQDGAR